MSSSTTSTLDVTERNYHPPGESTSAARLTVTRTGTTSHRSLRQQRPSVNQDREERETRTTSRRLQGAGCTDRGRRTSRLPSPSARQSGAKSSNSTPVAADRK